MNKYKPFIYKKSYNLNNYLDIRYRVRLYESYSLDVGSFKILAPYVKKKIKLWLYAHWCQNFFYLIKYLYIFHFHNFFLNSTIVQNVPMLCSLFILLKHVPSDSILCFSLFEFFSSALSGSHILGYNIKSYLFAYCKLCYGIYVCFIHLMHFEFINAIKNMY